MARRSTRKGQRRKTARRAYTGLKKTRRRRRYGSRRGRVSFRRRSSNSKGLIKRRAMGAVKECAWIAAGSATGLAATRWMPAGAAGMSSSTLFGLGALGYGVWRNDPKGVYLGFGAIYPEIYDRLRSVILPTPG